MSKSKWNIITHATLFSFSHVTLPFIGGDNMFEQIFEVLVLPCVLLATTILVEWMISPAVWFSSVPQLLLITHKQLLFRRYLATHYSPFMVSNIYIYTSERYLLLPIKFLITRWGFVACPHLFHKKKGFFNYH